MKKIILCILCSFCINKCVMAETTNYITGNLLPVAEEPEAEITDYELYEHSLKLTDSSGKELLELNLYDFCNMTETFNTDSIGFQCNKTGDLVIKLYKGDDFERKLLSSTLDGYKSASVVISDKKFTFSYAESDENMCVYVKKQEINELPEELFDVVYSLSEKRLYVRGCALPEKGRQALVTVSKKYNPLEIIHIEPITVNYYGEFQTDFKFNDSIDDIVITVSVGDDVYKINKITSDYTSENIKAILNGVYDNNGISVIMDINNAFIGNNFTSKIVAAFYNSDGCLILCRTSNNFDTRFKVSQIPEDTAKIRIFALDTLNGLKPQADPAEILLN